MFCASSREGANVATAYQSSEAECRALDIPPSLHHHHQQPALDSFDLFHSVSLHEYLSMPGNIAENLTVKASALGDAQF